MLVLSPPAHNNILLGSQACDKHEVSKKMNIEMEELFAPWVIENAKNLKDQANSSPFTCTIHKLLMPLMGSEDLQNLLKFAYALCSRALLRLLCLG